jgi:hypothetical protein
MPEPITMLVRLREAVDEHGRRCWPVTDDAERVPYIRPPGPFAHRRVKSNWIEDPKFAEMQRAQLAAIATRVDEDGEFVPVFGPPIIFPPWQHLHAGQLARQGTWKPRPQGPAMFPIDERFAQNQQWQESGVADYIRRMVAMLYPPPRTPSPPPARARYTAS